MWSSDAYGALSRVLELDAPRPLVHHLQPHFAQLAHLKNRKALSRSAIYSKLADEIRDATFGLEYHPFSTRSHLKNSAEPRFLRIAAWNVERGKRLQEILAFFEQNPLLASADIVLLNEVDIGMGRSANRNVAKEIARARCLNYVFGNSYVCLSPGNQRDGSPNTKNDLGLHGNAILSRYPIRRAETFSVAITRDKFRSSEKRLGHKKALWAQIDTPLGTLTALSVHLDSIASPRQRAAQLYDALQKLQTRNIAEAVIVGGDFNTTTYDIKNPFRLVWNLLCKFARGGFPHAIHHYLHPHQLYEKAVFEQLDNAGYTYVDFNQPNIGTARYEVGDHDSESKVMEHLPKFAIDILRRKLKPWNGVAELKIDWFAGRGTRPLQRAEFTDPNGRTSIAPTTLCKPTVQGVRISDHDPILVDIAFC